MRVSHEATVTQPVDAVWQSLSDIDSVLAALPGAALARSVDEVSGAAAVSGSLKCKLGSTQITYRVTAQAEVGEPGFHSAVITVSGQEARGSGSISATLTIALRSDAADTTIEINGDVAATGRGEAASARAWERVIALLVNALVPPTNPIESPPRPTRPPLTVAPPPAPTPSPSSGPAIPPWAIGAGALAFLVLLARRRSARRK